jgi:hypothetical protein
MIRIVFIFLSILYYQITIAQREFNECDSTLYTLNADTIVVAGKRQLYIQTNSNLFPISDFSTTDPDEYIRDFDIVKPNLWFTVVGSRYIGSPAQLYKSINQGQSWTLDTSHYNASNVQFLSPSFLQSINNLQHLGGDTIVMFMDYYISGIIYTTDAGATWTKWFDNLITHYQGMMECDNKYYIFGYEGDAFRPWMFGFDKSLLFTSDSAGAWNSFSNMSNHPNCSTSNDTVNCIYASSNLSRCATYNYFKSFIDSICNPLALNTIENEIFHIYPNPTEEFLNIISPTSEPSRLSIYNSIGEIVTNYTSIKMGKEIRVDLTNQSTGIYFLRIDYKGSMYNFKYIKKQS